MIHPIKRLKEWMPRPFRWLKEGMPLKGKVIIAVLLLAMMAGGGVVAYNFYDFTQNNPKFCVGCHLMQPAYDAWATSVHKMINCHDCHHLTIPEQNKLLINFILHRPAVVPERHGKIIVPWEYCMQCHWKKDKKYLNAPIINRSVMHAKHSFIEQITCSECHGSIGPKKEGLHQFLPSEQFCIKCHKGKEVHGTGMEKLACLNCHTDRTTSLRPDREKCLLCHGDEKVRKSLYKDKDPTLDIKYFKPDPTVMAKASSRTVFPPSAPMQRFYCFECHKPHSNVKPTQEDCVKCHAVELGVGKHPIHLQGFGLKCLNCHKPHQWRVTEAVAKVECVKCHDYRDPKKFIE
jgi:cytochrome c nitrite reductase small subunit